MTDRPRPRREAKQRGPLVSSRTVLSKEDLEAENALPWKMFAEATAFVTHDLMSRVGYDHPKFTIVIEPLKKEHPQAPGYMIAAKMRRP